MAVKEEMNEIEETIEEILTVARKRNAKQTAKSRLKVYRKALKEVQQIAGNDPMRELADWIREQIDDVSVDVPKSDGEVTVRLDEDETRTATIVEENSPTEAVPPKIRLEYVTDGATRAKQKATQIKRLLSRRAK